MWQQQRGEENIEKTFCWICWKKHDDLVPTKENPLSDFEEDSVELNEEIKVSVLLCSGYLLLLCLTFHVFEDRYLFMLVCFLRFTHSVSLLVLPNSGTVKK